VGWWCVWVSVASDGSNEPFGTEFQRACVRPAGGPFTSNPLFSFSAFNLSGDFQEFSSYYCFFLKYKNN
jgi:hypothetical protein